MQSILRIKQRRSIAHEAVNQSFNAAREMLRLCLMRRMRCMTAFLLRLSTKPNARLFHTGKAGLLVWRGRGAYSFSKRLMNCWPLLPRTCTK